MDPHDKELVRLSALENLVARFPVVQAIPSLKRAVEREVPFKITTEDVEAAVIYWRELGNAEFIQDEAGPTQWWKATTKGVQHVERKT